MRGGIYNGFIFWTLNRVSPGRGCRQGGESMEKEFMTVSIPTSLYKKIEEIIKGTEVSSVSSYISKVLREKLSQEKEAGEVFSKEDEEKVKERLKALGYID
jgi:Arc/MetJ-type ribon-helix-helix transcriptional regulator